MPYLFKTYKFLKEKILSKQILNVIIIFINCNSKIKKNLIETVFQQTVVVSLFLLNKKLNISIITF